MKIGAFGTGILGQTISAKLGGPGHDGMLGARDVTNTLGRDEPGRYGNPPFRLWREQCPERKLGAFNFKIVR